MLFDQIASNKRRTWILLIAFFILLALIGAAVGYLWLGSSLGGVILALIIGGIYAFSMIFQSTEVVMRMNGAREVTEEQAPQLYHIVQDMAMVAQIPMPRVYNSVTKSLPFMAVTDKTSLVKRGLVAANLFP